MSTLSISEPTLYMSLSLGRMNEKPSASQRQPVHWSEAQLGAIWRVNVPSQDAGGRAIWFSSLSIPTILCFPPVVSDGLEVATLSGPVSLSQMLASMLQRLCGCVWQGPVLVSFGAFHRNN